MTKEIWKDIPRNSISKSRLATHVSESKYKLKYLELLLKEW